MKTVFMLVAILVSFSVSAQDVCTPEEKPHYYVATGTVKTTVPNSLSSVLTANEKLIWTSTFRTFSVVSPAHENLAACNEGLEFLRAQRAIAIKAPIHALQSVSYEGFCLATSICP